MKKEEPTERISLTLDLSKLAPALRRRVCEKIQVMARTDANQLESDLESFTPGEARDDMDGWQKAAKALEKHTIAMYRQDLELLR
jgi:hypothetical protein